MKTNKRVLSGPEWLRWWFLLYIWYLWVEVTPGSLENFFSDKTTSEKYTLWLLNQRAEKKWAEIEIASKMPFANDDDHG